MSMRHRWKLTSNDPKAPQCCIKCGLLRLEEYNCLRLYWKGGRRWKRFAPPCPPPQEEGATATQQKKENTQCQI